MKAEELFREVDEELQRDRMIALWKRWGGPVVAGVTVLVLAVAGWQGWQWWQHREAVQAAQRYAVAEQLLEQDRPAEAAAAFERFAAEAPAGFATMARLQAATAAIEAGDRAAGLAALEAVASGAEDPLLRDLATVLAVTMQIDEAEPRALIGRLEPLATDTGAWRHLAREMIAVAALRAGEQARAIEALEALEQDAEAPQGARQRATELLQALGAESTGTTP